MKHLLQLAVFLVCYFYVGCSPDTSGFPTMNNDVSINLVLRSDLDSQSVSLRTLRDFSDDSWQAITNATIKVTDSQNQSWDFEFDSNTNQYIAKPFRPTPNSTYYLSVSLNNVRTIRGQTTIPPKQHVSSSGRTLTWDMLPNSASRIYVKGTDTTTNIFKEILYSVFYDWNSATTNNTITIPSSFLYYSGNSSDEKTVTHTFRSNKYYRVQVEAYDSNMTIFSTEALSRKGLNTDYGVFGSVSVLDTVLKLSD